MSDSGNLKRFGDKGDIGLIINWTLNIIVLYNKCSTCWIEPSLDALDVQYIIIIQDKYYLLNLLRIFIKLKQKVRLES